MSGLRELVERVRPFVDEVRARSCEPHYGYPVVENPHDFDPDPECCTPQEIAIHKVACEAWDRGERDVRPAMCGSLASNGWGIGAQTIHDPALSAAADLLDHLLSHPEAVEAVEVLRRLGEARETCRKWRGTLTRPAQRIEDERRHEHARDAVAELADRLADGGDRG